jgi:sulfur relay (sulfurtransferase) complex TusBCD TusD component (DsrE family)
LLIRNYFAALAVTAVLAATPAAAANPGGLLFVNLTTDEAHRADMAMTFSKAMMERDHPVVVWLNDKGVLIAAKENGGKFAPQQKMLSQLMHAGATVIACPMCMKHYGVKESDLMHGVKVGNPDLTSDLLFQQDTKTLTW